jgi:hypothetical protein
MGDLDFHLIQPPYFQLEEAIDWIELTQIPEGQRDGWQSVIESVRLLEEKLLSGDLKAFASLDTSPVQLIAAYTWTEFTIQFLRPDGKILWQKDHGDIGGYMVTSQPQAYRSVALKDLSQPANVKVPGPDGPEPGFYRVMSQVIFLEENLTTFFPSTVKTSRFENSPMLQRLDEILRAMSTPDTKLEESPKPFTQRGLAKKIKEYCGAHGLEPFQSNEAIARGLSRYYERRAKQPLRNV